MKKLLITPNITADGISIDIDESVLKFTNIDAWSNELLKIDDDHYDIDLTLLSQHPIIYGTNKESVDYNLKLVFFKEFNPSTLDLSNFVIVLDEDQITVLTFFPIVSCSGFDEIINLKTERYFNYRLITMQLYKNSKVFNNFRKTAAIKNNAHYLVFYDLDFEDYKTYMFYRLSDFIELVLKSGVIFSNSLNIKVDCRRFGNKNDLQNVYSLILYMNTNNIDTYYFKGYNETVEVTVPLLEALAQELSFAELEINHIKWNVQNIINSAKSMEELKSINFENYFKNMLP